MDVAGSKIQNLLAKNNMINKQSDTNKYTSSENTSHNNNVLYVEPTLFGSGNINPFSSRLSISFLTINSVFRPNYNNSLSTDFIVELPDPFKKVASYELVSFSCLPVFYNINSFNHSNKMIIAIQNPPNIVSDIYVIIEVEPGIYQPNDMVNYFNQIFISSSNGLQFLRCSYNNNSKKIAFRAYNYLIDGYLIQLVNGNPVLGGGPYDENIINPLNPLEIIPNPFYNSACIFTFDFSTDNLITKPVYKNLGWVLGFTSCRYEITIDTCYTNYNNAYFNFYNYFNSKTPFLPGYTNDLYLQKYFGFDTSALDIYGYIQGENIFVDRSLIPNTGIYLFLDIDDYNKNYNPSATTALSENFESTFSATTFAKINLSTTNITIDNTPNRAFYGPVDLRRLHIRLLNEYGDVIYLQSDFAFTLRITQIY